MKRRIAVVALVFVAFALITQQALAVSPHLKGKNAVAFTDNGLTLTATVS